MKFGVFLLMLFPMAMADDRCNPVKVSTGNSLIRVSKGSPYSFRLSSDGTWRYIDKLTFSARAEKSASKISVSVDGETRCEIDLTANLANQTCSVQRTARQVTVSQISGDDVFVSKLISFQSSAAPQKLDTSDLSEFGGLSSRKRDEAFEEDASEVNPPEGAQMAPYLAQKTIRVIQLLSRRLQQAEDEDGNPLQAPGDQVLGDLNNVKVVAAEALAAARPNRDLSFTTLFKMLRLQKQIDGIRETTVLLLRRSDSYSLALELLTIREFIEDRLDTYRLEKMLEKDPETLKKLLSSEAQK